MKRAASKQEGLFADDLVGEEVTAIARSARNPSRWTVKAGRKTIATVEREDLDAAGIQVGDVLAPATAEALLAAGARLKARDDAARMIARRAKSRGQLVDALVRKGHTPQAANAAADRMIAIGALDDRSFAADVVRSALARKAAGARFLEGKLREKRVPREIASEAVRAALKDIDQAGDAEALAVKRVRALSGRLEPDAARRRLYSFLARRGFEHDVCARAVERALRGRDAKSED